MALLSVVLPGTGGALAESHQQRRHQYSLHLLLVIVLKSSLQSCYSVDYLELTNTSARAVKVL